MRNLLIGNGINIQYSNGEYLNKSIINRAIKNVIEGNFDKSAYSNEVIEWLDESYMEGVKIFEDGLEKSMIMAWTDNQKTSLEKFYDTYKNQQLRKESIGFEYYFLLNDLFCNRNKIPRSTDWTKDIRGQREEGLRRFFIDSIYNHGEINRLYLNFPRQLRDYMFEFQNILTTNYDSNIENFTNIKVNYLHGAFHILDLKYDNSDIVNIALGTKTQINKNSEHLYSIAITNFCGEEKLEHLMRAQRINTLFPYAQKMLDESKRTNSKMNAKIERILQIASENPDYTVPDKYNFIRIDGIEGELVIIGLSPHNDNHIFQKIIENPRITNIDYKSFCKDEAKFAEQYFASRKINISSVKEFWNSLA